MRSIMKHRDHVRNLANFVNAIFLLNEIPVTTLDRFCSQKN